MNDVITKAQILFKDVVIDEGLQFDDEFGKHLFSTAVFCYVPHMVQMHREVWTEEQLLIFYFSNETYSDVCGRAGRRGKLIFQPAESLGVIPEIFESIVNIVGHPLPLPKEAIPDYYFIDPKHFKRVLNLLAFS